MAANTIMELLDLIKMDKFLKYSDEQTVERWQNGKTNWMNVKAFHKPPIKRPNINANNNCMEEILPLESLILTNSLTSESLDNEWGQKINEFFIQHLLIVHEMHCKVCFETNTALDVSKELDPDTGDRTVQILEPLLRKTKSDSNDKGTQTVAKIPTRNISGKYLKPGKSSKSKSKAETSKTRVAKKVQEKREEHSSDTTVAKIPVNLSKIVQWNAQGKESSCESSDDDIDTEDEKDGDTEDDEKDRASDDSDSSNKQDDEASDYEFEVNLESSNEFQVNLESSNEFQVNLESSKSSNMELQIASPKTMAEKKYKCTLCDNSYSRPGVLKLHVETRHMGMKYKCEICNREYTQAARLRSHMVVHTEGKVDCLECGKKFMTLSNLKIHTKNQHEPKTEIFKCDICGNIYSSKLSLKLHADVHIDEKSFVCDICGKAFKRKYGLTSHMAFHNGEKKYSCDVCDARFVHISLVYKHKKKKHGERDELCTVCGKSFFTVELLNRHTRTHSEEPHFKCRECGKQYRSETAYRVHLNTHKGILPKPQNRRPKKKPQTVTTVSTVETREVIVNPATFQAPNAHPSFVHYEYEDYRYF